jgi:tetratricopeptide (TPR) repeat protein
VAFWGPGWIAIKRLYVDLGADGRAAVSAAVGSGIPWQVGEPARLDWPMTTAELTDLRWYLEDYLHTPFGVYDERGEQVAGRIGEWGVRVFDAVFGAGPARDACRGGPIAEIVFRSAVPRWLALPWELVHDPGSRQPLALTGTTISRRISGGSGEPVRIDYRRLRVLMVISRPRGTGDVGYRTIARPLLEQLATVRDQVELVVLRPPTLAALTEALRAALVAGEPFHVVHFDGHGTRFAGTGVLGFEGADGGEDPVPAGDVAAALAGAAVPVVVLNACHSGAVGKELEVSIATRLLAEGTSSVVAMAYSVYAVAAARFMTAFYAHLVAGGRVADAVTVGRGWLAAENTRPSRKGPQPLSDWMVPVHYSCRDVVFEYRSAPPSGATAGQAAVTDAWAGQFEAHDAFVGRDGLFYDLEVAARLRGVVLLHGPAGTGKTELAKAFGRWWRDTGAVAEPNLVVWHSFEPGSASFTLQAVLSAVGPQLLGKGSELLTPGERRRRVLAALAARRALVVWDNFEAVHSMPDPATAIPPLDKAGRDELLAFLAEVAAGGRSTVLITSRSTEPWLGDVRRLPVPGLSREEANEYADRLLARHPGAQRRREDRAFGELMEWLDGHPLSMRLILPRLDDTQPRALLHELRGLRPLPDDDAGSRTTSLAASTTYSLNHLCAKTRRLLVVVSLFHGAVDAGVLALFSQQPAVPTRFADADLDGWTAALREASDAGLLSPLRGSTHAVHPALPAYLVTTWRAEGHNTYVMERAAAHIVLLDAFVAFAGWASREIDSGNDGAPLAMLGLHRRNLGDLLTYSLKRQRWRAARIILRALDQYWSAEGAQQEALGWNDRALLLVESAAAGPPPLDGLAGSARIDREVWFAEDNPGKPESPAASVWRYLVIMRAHRLHRAGALDRAERAYTEIYEVLAPHKRSPEVSRNAAEICGALATIADKQGRPAEADAWHRKQRELAKGSSNRAGASRTDDHRAGLLAHRAGRLDEAEACYRRSLVQGKNEGDWYGVAADHRQLGVIAEARGLLDEAEACYLRARDASRMLANPAHEALIDIYLGALALRRGEPADAEHWFRESLVRNERLGLRADTSLCYHALGLVAQRGGRLDEAESLFRGSLAIDEELGDHGGEARAYTTLGQLASFSALHMR